MGLQCIHMLQPSMQQECRHIILCLGKLGMLHRTNLQTSNLSLLPQHPSLIELKLLALQDVPIAATALSRARADACIQTTSGKLVIQMLV